MDRLDRIEKIMEGWATAHAKTEASLDRLSVAVTELTMEQAETQRSLRELDAKLGKMAVDTDRLLKNMAKDGERRLKKLEKLYGGVSENSGRHAEEFFQHALEKTLTFGGIKFDKIDPNLNKTGSKNCEFDIGLKNGTSIALIEVKNRVRTEFVEELATIKLARFRKFMTGYANYEVYLGLAGFSFEKAVFDEAKKYGVGVIRQVGDSVQVDKGRLKVY